MATLIKGKTFTNGELVTPASIHQLVDAATISGIVNADISSSAAIADTKLATISTANKVSQSAVTNLTTDLAEKAPATGIAPSAITGTAVVTADARLSDARTPTTHTHGNISNAGAIGTTAHLPVVTGASGVLTSLPAGTAGQVLTSNGGSSAPSFQTLAATSTNANNLTGGSAGTVPYQSAAGTTAMLAAGTSGQVLRSNGTSAPSWLTLGNSATTDTTNASNIASGTLANARTTATSANTASAIVARDASGNFSAGTITANLTGNASTVTTNANLTGDVTSVGNATSIASGVIVDADINASAAIADTKLATISTAGKVSNSATTATNANTASTIVARNASGNFSAGSITGDAVNSSFGAIRIGRGSGNDATNTALGGGAPLSSITNGVNNVAVGYDSQKLTTTGDRNVSVGQEALFQNTTGSGNVAIGTVAGNQNSGSLNTAIGDSAAYNNTGVGNTALGAYSLNLHTTANNSTAIGYSAGSTGNFTNSTCLGYTADVTANNQVQLGNSSTTTFAFGAVQNRSDERDKADIRPTILGLDFIKAIEPVDYKWDFREDYRPAPPQSPGLNATQAELDEYASAKSKYLEDIKFVNLTTNGTHKRTRYHHGVIAQQVQQVIDLSGVDFGGFQDHKIGGGDDVLSIGYLEFIAPLIKAVQELAARVEALEAAQP